MLHSNMELPYILIFFVFLFASSEAAKCDNDWIAYKDETCVKLFPTTFIGYDEAKDFCSYQGSENVVSSLVMIKEGEMQELLANYTLDIVDNVWLGGKYDPDAEQFKWEDGNPLTYTNWQESYPKNVNDSVTCIEFRPSNIRSDTKTNGQWANTLCQKRNLVMCQKPLVWTLQDAIDQIIRMRKQLVEATTERNELRQELITVNARVVPVGSVYIEYNGQPDPTALWPYLVWEDISNSYAGHFFRVSGGGSEEWGVTQTECAPRITQVQYGERSTVYPFTTDVPENGWSEDVYTGAMFQNGNYRAESLKFHTAGCEVRPINQAVRVWKRIA